MTAAVDRSPLLEASHRSDGAPRRIPAGLRGRRPLTLVVSAAVVFASIASFAALYSSSDRQVSVLMVTTTIQQGQRINGTDLGRASVAASGVASIAVSEASELAGKRAAVTIPAGSLLIPADITAAPPIAAGDAVVGLALKSGQLPSDGVEPGDQVMIVQTSSPGTPVAGSSAPATSVGAYGSATGILVPQATVFDTAVPPIGSSSGDTELVSVEVSATLGASVSTDAAADQVTLVLLPRDSGQSGGQST